MSPRIYCSGIDERSEMRNGVFLHKSEQANLSPDIVSRAGSRFGGASCEKKFGAPLRDFSAVERLLHHKFTGDHP